MSIAAPVDLNELADRISTEVAAATRMPQLDACRSLLQETGLRRARMALVESPDLIADAQARYRVAQAAHAAAKESRDQALSEAEWALDDRFQSDGNKTYLRIGCDDPAADCPVCQGIGSYRKSLTADERRAWKDREARNVPAVASSARALSQAEENVAAARDDITVAQARLTAAKHALDAAVAEVQVLAIGMQAKEIAR